MMNIAPDLQPLYQMKQRPWGGSRAVPQFIDTYQENDTRLEETWLYGPQVNAEGDTLIHFVKDVPGLKIVPMHNGYRAHKCEVYKQIGVNSDVDFPIFQYTEILMMKAEALLRIGRADEAAQIVTRIRERAFLDNDKAKVTAAGLQSGSKYNYDILGDGRVVDSEGGEDVEYGRFLDELGWEFAMEGHRRQY